MGERLWVFGLLCPVSQRLFLQNVCPNLLWPHICHLLFCPCLSRYSLSVSLLRSWSSSLRFPFSCSFSLSLPPSLALTLSLSHSLVLKHSLSPYVHSVPCASQPLPESKLVWRNALKAFPDQELIHERTCSLAFSDPSSDFLVFLSLSCIYQYAPYPYFQ